MAESRQLALEELRRLLPREGFSGEILYSRMLDYPLREAKALRPALAISVCRALGGTLEGIVKSAAVLELYHNAFLIHDDIEDGSDMRRNGPTLHRTFGVPIAVNVGDAMLAASLAPLLENMALLGLGKALKILAFVAQMSRETAEGQALELEWVRNGTWAVTDQQYLRMVHKKTTWYSFLAPVELGCIVASASPTIRWRFHALASAIGAAFQIQDDILNVTAEETRYGKESCGDLWEGKHTLIVARTLRVCSPTEQQHIVRILQKPRPPSEELGQLGAVLDELRAQRQMTADAHERLSGVLERGLGAARFKTSEDVEYLGDLVQRYDGVTYAARVAQRRAQFAERALAGLARSLAPSVHRDFIEGLVEFVVNRDR